MSKCGHIEVLIDNKFLDTGIILNMSTGEERSGTRFKFYYLPNG